MPGIGVPTWQVRSRVRSAHGFLRRRVRSVVPAAHQLENVGPVQPPHDDGPLAGLATASYGILRVIASVS